jgi:mitochondrial import inner membrane translocase subunit TIM16
MAVGPIARLLAQIIVPVIAVVARAIPAAYAQALQNARKSGAASSTTTASAAASNLLRTKQMSPTEATSVLNLNETEVTNLDAIERQYTKYMGANEVKKIPGTAINTGSFYLQSKIYRAREALIQYQKEQSTKESSKDNNNNQQQ